jgi:hypothetical protein
VVLPAHAERRLRLRPRRRERAGRHQVNGKPLHLDLEADRNGFAYAVDRDDGRFVWGAPFVKKVTWTKGLDPETGKPVEYDPHLRVQKYNAAVTRGARCQDARRAVAFRDRWRRQRTPITFQVDGKQYVAVLVGMGGAWGEWFIAMNPSSTLYVFALE